MGNPLMRSRPHAISPHDTKVSHDDTKICPYCAETIKAAAIVCRYCGRELSATQQPPAASVTPPSITSASVPQAKPTYVPPKRSGCATVGGYILIGILVIGLLMVVAAFASTSNNGGVSTSGLSATPTRTLSNAEIKKRSIEITYDNLARNTEGYEGLIVHFQGEVLQVMESSWDNSTDLRVYMDDGDAIYVHYSGPRVLEGDQVDIYARVDGRLTYETVLGAEVTIPETTAQILTIVAK